MCNVSGIGDWCVSHPTCHPPIPLQKLTVVQFDDVHGYVHGFFGLLIPARSLLIHVRNPLFRIPLLTHQTFNKNLKFWRLDVKTWCALWRSDVRFNVFDIRTYCPGAGIWYTLRRFNVKTWSFFVVKSSNKNKSLMLWCKVLKFIECSMRRDWISPCEEIECPMRRDWIFLCEGTKFLRAKRLNIPRSIVTNGFLFFFQFFFFLRQQI